MGRLACNRLADSLGSRKKPALLGIGPWGLHLQSQVKHPADYGAWLLAQHRGPDCRLIGGGAGGARTPHVSKPARQQRYDRPA
jgi:hypothetical protein